MFSLRRRSPIPPVNLRPVPLEHIVALVKRMRALSLKDAELGRLLEELAPYLPPDAPPG